jgi:SET domain-containing protein
MTSPRRRRPSSKRRAASRRGSKEAAPLPAVIVRRSSLDGRGGFAARRLEAGDRVIEYAGQRISRREADRRDDTTVRGRPHTFLFELTSRTVIDAAVDGNEARFINHSCQPNCEAVSERGKIIIRALRRIRTGEELTYDYALPRDKELGAAEDALYPCRCGARACRGTLLD